MTRSKPIPISLIAIIVVGFLLRLHDLGTESLWLDEGTSALYGKLGFAELFSLPEENPPLYYIFLHLWVELFGDSEVSLRFPSVVFGTLSIFFIYKIGHLVFSKNVGILSSLLLAVSLFHIRYSQEARTYSLSVFLSLLSMYFFIQLLNRHKKFILVGYILASILLMYSHVYGFFIIIAQNIYFVIVSLLSKEDDMFSFYKWISLQFILIILFVPWIAKLITSVLYMQTSGHLSYMQIPSLITLFKTFVTFSYYNKAIFFLFFSLSVFAVLQLDKIKGEFSHKHFFRSIEGYTWNVRLSKTDPICLLALWLLTPVFLPFMISRFLHPIYTVKYTIVASLALYLLTAKGISNIRKKHIKSIITFLIIFFSFIPTFEYYKEINKEQWRDVANFIEINAKNDDLVLFNAFFCQTSIYSYYSKRKNLNLQGFPKTSKKVTNENISSLWETVGDHERVWVVLSHSGDENELIVKTLATSYNLIFYNKYKGIELYHFRKSRNEHGSLLSVFPP